MKFQLGGIPRARREIERLPLIYGGSLPAMAFCNLHHLHYWLMRSRAELFTVGFLPGALFWSLRQSDFSVFLVATLQSAKEALSSCKCPPAPRVGWTPADRWQRGSHFDAEVLICPSLPINVFEISLMVAGLHSGIKHPSLRSKGNHLDSVHPILWKSETSNHQTMVCIGVCLFVLTKLAKQSSFQFISWTLSLL